MVKLPSNLIFRLMTGLALTLLLVGCTKPGDEVGANPGVASSPADRALARWDALLAGDFGKAYDFASPAFREKEQRELYVRKFPGDVRWDKVKFIRVDPKGEDRAEVWINLAFRYNDMQAGASHDMTTDLRETWILAEGVWWYEPETR